MKDDEEYLISYANFKCNLFTHQKNFLSLKELEQFYKKVYLGFPICLPSAIKYFNYKQKDRELRMNKKIYFRLWSLA